MEAAAAAADEVVVVVGEEEEAKGETSVDDAAEREQKEEEALSAQLRGGDEPSSAGRNDNDSHHSKKAPRQSQRAPPAASAKADNNMADDAVRLVKSGSFGVAVAITEETKDERIQRTDANFDDKAIRSTTTPPPVFVNHGLATWEQNRQKWLDHKEKTSRVAEEHAVPVNVDEIIDVVFASPRQLRANGGKGRNFPKPVKLPQMVDILQDLWEAEGLDV